MFARSRTVRCWIIVSAAAVALAGVSTPLAADDGSIVAWGSNWAGQTDVPAPNSGFVAVAGGGNHSLGLKATPGDLNCDGQINALDIEPFLVALFDPENYPVQYPNCNINNGDINGDGRIDALDIEPFLGLLFP